MSILCAAWPQNRSVLGPLGTAVCWLLVSGCSDESHSLGGAQTASVTRPHASLCSDGVELESIDDMEDGDGSIDMTAARSGVWFSFHDKTGGEQLPANDVETFPMAELVPPRAASHHAAHSQGGGFTKWGAGIGFEIYSQKAYDVSSYAGITFWARGAANATSTLRFAVTDAATAPRGHQCHDYEDYQECGDYFGSDVSLSTSFQRYSFTWQELTQGTWGMPHPDSVDTSQVYGIRFQVAQNQDFDFWIDDIAFLCKAD